MDNAAGDENWRGKNPELQKDTVYYAPTNHNLGSSSIEDNDYAFMPSPNTVGN